MHLEFYRQRPKTMGVLHGHRVFATAFASAGRELPHNILPELVAIIGRFPTIPYGRPSSSRLAAMLAPHATKHNVFLLQNHGAAAVGTSVRDAYHPSRSRRGLCKNGLAAEFLGGVKPRTQAEISDLPGPSFD